MFSPLNSLRVFLGGAGIAEDESALAQRLGEIFYWVMLLIVFWLPFASYFELHNDMFPTVCEIADWIIWITFVIKTTILTALVRRKLYYLATNWSSVFIVIVGCPLIWSFFPQLSEIRILRLMLFVSIIVPWVPVGYRFLAHNSFGTTLLIAVIASGLSGALISIFDSGIKSPWMGIWWAWETFTTVGYGDVVPTTFVGRAVAVVIMILGACLYSLLTANFAAFLMRKSKIGKVGYISERERLLQILKRLETKVENLEKHLLPESSEEE